MTGAQAGSGLPPSGSLTTHNLQLTTPPQTPLTGESGHHSRSPVSAAEREASFEAGGLDSLFPARPLGNPPPHRLPRQSIRATMRLVNRPVTKWESCLRLWQVSRAQPVAKTTVE